MGKAQNFLTAPRTYLLGITFEIKALILAIRKGFSAMAQFNSEIKTVSLRLAHEGQIEVNFIYLLQCEASLLCSIGQIGTPKAVIMSK